MKQIVRSDSLKLKHNITYGAALGLKYSKRVNYIISII